MKIVQKPAFEVVSVERILSLIMPENDCFQMPQNALKVPFGHSVFWLVSLLYIILYRLLFSLFLSSFLLFMVPNHSCGVLHLGVSGAVLHANIMGCSMCFTPLCAILIAPDISILKLR